jgi:hypothetical protein
MSLLKRYIPALLKDTLDIAGHQYVHLSTEEKTKKVLCDFSVKFAKFWDENKDKSNVANLFIEQFITPVVNTQLIPETLRKMAMKFLAGYLKDKFVTNRAQIDAFAKALLIEVPVLEKDPVFAYAAEVRQKSEALSKKFSPAFINLVPPEYRDFVPVSYVEPVITSAFYHIFGRLQLKFNAKNFDELQSKVIAHAHVKIKEIANRGRQDRALNRLTPQSFNEIAKELIDDILPGLNLATHIGYGELAKILFNAHDVLSHEESSPRGEVFGPDADKEIKPFLQSASRKILELVLKEPLSIVSDIVALKPQELNNPDTFSIAEKGLTNQLLVGFKNLFKNDPEEEDPALYQQFGNWVDLIPFDKSDKLNEGVAKVEVQGLLSHIHPDYQPYFIAWLEKKLPKEQIGSFAAFLNETKEIGELLKPLTPLFRAKEANRVGFEKGAAVLLKSMKDYGDLKNELYQEFSLWVKNSGYKSFPYSLTEVEKNDAIEALLNKVPEKCRDYLFLLLEHHFNDPKEIASFARYLMDKKFDDIVPLILNIKALDKVTGTILLKKLLPSLSKYPLFVDVVTDLLPETLFRMMKALPLKIAANLSQDIESFENPPTEKGMALGKLLKSCKPLIDEISKTAKHKGVELGPHLTGFIVEKAAIHIVNNYQLIANSSDPVAELIAEVSNLYPLLSLNDQQRSWLASDLITYCLPMVKAFEERGHAAVEKILKEGLDKLKMKDLTVYQTDLINLLFPDVSEEDKAKFGAQLTRGVDALSKFIIDQIKKSSAKKVDDVLASVLTTDNNLWSEVRRQLNTLLLKGIRNLLVKVEKEEPGLSKINLVSRSLQYLCKMVFESANNVELAGSLFDLFEMEQDLNIDLKSIRNDILPKLLSKYRYQLFAWIDEIEENEEIIKKVFEKDLVNEAVDKISNIWLRDFIPFFLSGKKDEVAVLLKDQINKFLKIDWITDNELPLIEANLQALSENPETNPIRPGLEFAGKYTQAFILKVVATLFEGKDLTDLADQIGRMVIKDAASYFQMVKTVKNQIGAKHLTENNLRARLGPLFSDAMPLEGELTDRKKAFYQKTSLKIALHGGIDEDDLPMIDVLQSPVHELILQNLLPQVLHSIVNNVGSTKTINTALIKTIENVLRNLKADWSKEEQEYERVHVLLDDLNYRLCYRFNFDDEDVQNFIERVKHTDKSVKNVVDVVFLIKKLITDCKNQYGADSVQMDDMFTFVINSVHKNFGLDDLQSLFRGVLLRTQDIENKWKSLKENTEFVEHLRQLLDGIIMLAPSKLLAALFQINSISEMGAVQVGVMYEQFMREQTFVDWVNNGIESLLPSMIPNGQFVDGKFVSKTEAPLSVVHVDVPYSRYDEARDKKKIINGTVKIAVDGFEKSISRKMWTFFRDLRMKFGLFMMKLFGLRVVKIRDFINKVYDFILNNYVVKIICGAIGFAIGFIFKKLADWCWIRWEVKPHYDGVHSTYSKNFIALMFEKVLDKVLEAPLNEQPAD